MLFFGWGRRSLQKLLGENQALVLSYAYFHLFFFFTVTYGYKYNLATLREEGWHSKPITKEEAQNLLHGEQLKPSAWKQFSLIGLIVLGFILGMIANLTPQQ